MEVHSSDKKKKIKKKVDPTDFKMISLKKVRVAAKKINDMRSTKSIILRRESDQGKHEAKRAKKSKSEWSN